MHRSRLIGVAAACLLALAGCGGTAARHHSVPATSTASHACPPNASFMGCDTSRAFRLSPRASSAAPSGALFPDVSVWQRAVNWVAVAAWQRAHGWRPAAIFKLGEYTLDGQAVRNAAQTAALGFWRAGYWFVRNTGCQHEAALIVWAAKRFGLRIVVLDAEVPEARGYSACLAPLLRAAGLIVVEYTSPGSNPDGSNPGLDEWVASYGAAHVPCLFTCSVEVGGRQSILAWQFTDGAFGPAVTVPGVGRDDVSVDYGITRLGVQSKPKLLPVCIHHRMTRAKCSSAKAKVASDNRTVINSRAALRSANRTLSAHRCVRPYRRGVCVRAGRDARVFRQRVRFFGAAAARLTAAN